MTPKSFDELLQHLIDRGETNIKVVTVNTLTTNKEKVLKKFYELQNGKMCRMLPDGIFARVDDQWAFTQTGPKGDPNTEYILMKMN